jgi:deoxyribonuclease V
MPLRIRHKPRWDLSPQEAMQDQKELREQIRIDALPDEAIKTVGGIDASFGKQEIYSAVVVLNYPTLETVERAEAQEQINFPYIPGLLSFREAPAFLTGLARLKSLPDVLIVDGHGFAHPRRFGLACHLGVLLDLPTIGCAKSILVGEVGHLDTSRGSTAEIWDGQEVLGLAVRTREKVKPVYVSIGHRVDLPSSARIILACASGYRLPEPTRQAHNLAKQIKPDRIVD